MSPKNKSDLKLQVKTAASGNWQNIISSITGVDTIILNGKHHPCPLCGGKDRFRFLNYDGSGGAMCSQCKPSGMGDGIAVIKWLSSLSFIDALHAIARHLNIDIPTAKTKKTRHKKNPRSQFENVAQNQVGLLLYAHAVPSITVQSLKDNDADTATLNTATTVVRLPIHNLKLEIQGYISRNITGKPIIRTDPVDGTTTKRKSLASRGAKPGLMGAYAIKNIAVAETVWKVEGETDMLALHAAIASADTLPPKERSKHVVVASSFGANYSNKYTEILPLFRSKHVVIIGDNDENGTGARGARDWAAQIKIPAKNVKILPLPKQHNDVRDFLAAGGTFAQLLEIATTTPEIPGDDADVLSIKKDELLDRFRKITNSDTIGREFVAQYNYSDKPTFIYRSEKFYFYAHTHSDAIIRSTANKINCWTQVESGYVERLIRRFTIKYLDAKIQEEHNQGSNEDLLLPDISRNLITNILTAVQSYAFMSSSVSFNQLIQTDIDDNILGTGDQYYICMESNILAIPEKAGDMIATTPHTPLWFSQNILGYDYRQELNIPDNTHLYNFFASSFAGRTDNINLLLEYMAYTLFVPDCRFEKLLFLEGVSRGGKGVCTTLFRALIGSHNCSEISFKDCAKGPRVALLEGKLLNISEEESGFVDADATGYAKIIISGEPIMVEEKYQAPRTIQPTAKWLCTTNEFPLIKDRSEAFWNRLMIIKFCHAIPIARRNPRYKTIKFWIKSGEMPILFGAVLKAYRDLLRRGAFIIPAGMLDLVTEKRDISNPIQMALKELFYRSKGDSVEVGRVGEVVREWLKNNGHKDGVTTTNIEAGLLEVFGQADIGRPWRPTGDRPRSWKNIREHDEWSHTQNNQNTPKPDNNSKTEQSGPENTQLNFDDTFDDKSDSDKQNDQDDSERDTDFNFGSNNE